MSLVLSQFWDSESEEVQLAIANHGTGAIEAEKLCFSTMCWLLPGAEIEGGTLLRQIGTHHEISLDAPQLAAGATLRLTLRNLRHQPRNISHGIMAAWIENGSSVAQIACQPLRSEAPYEPVKPMGAGQLSDPMALLPWPVAAHVTQWRDQSVFRPGTGMDLARFEAVRALHHRLFPTARAVLSHDSGIPVNSEAGLDRGYELHFEAGAVRLVHDGGDGLLHGLVSLAQIAHGACAEHQMLVPSIGKISDAPRFDWRGSHVDVARNFMPFECLMRFADIMAWHKLNRMHLHLTDDEGWRIELPSLPELAKIAGRRGRDAPLPPQFGDGPDGQRGYYSVAQIETLLGHCATLGIEIMPEIDMPGHSLALLLAYPELRDPDEPEEAYRSVGGHPNNALNPGMPGVFELIAKILDDLCDIFPSEIIHIGGDEVPPGTWQESPAAQKLAKAEGINGDLEGLQSWFNARLLEMLRARGRRLGGWDECADGPGMTPENTLLFAWRNQDRIAALADRGHGVIATPGETYYMDMRQGEGWGAHGAIWAGPVPARKTYDFEVGDGLSPAQLAQVRGLQAGVWSEFLDSPKVLNYMMFPRFSAVAEAAWTTPERKDWDRFCAQSKLMPQL